MDTYGKKELFVQEELTALLRDATGGWVTECWYERKLGRETVHVKTQGNEPLEVDVTADSLWAIARDVMSAVAERYE